MKNAQIIHNPTAGDAEHSKEDLLQIVEDSGYKVKYASTHDNSWKDFDQEDTDLIFLAGGDGTVQKLAALLLEKKILDRKIPIYLLPLGTANNIAKALEIPLDISLEKIKPEQHIKKYDCGRISKLKEESFFLESVGFGIFPQLISTMDENKVENESPSEEIKRSLITLLEIIKTFEAKKVKIETEGISIKGKFLLVELMNNKAIGPNFELAPEANPGDGFFNLIMIPEQCRSGLENYVSNIVNNNKQTSELADFVKSLRVKNLKMKCSDCQLHVDDKLIENYSRKKFKVDVIPGALEFTGNA